MELPVYELAIDMDAKSDLSVSFIALVDKPAIERNFLAFTDNKKRLEFAVIDQDRRIISGLAMAADELVYRKDNEFGEYNVVFKPATIYDIVQKFFALGYNNNFNIMHDPQMVCSGVTVFESFIYDPERGISPMKGFEDVKPGSWFMSAKVQNDEVWKAIKNGLVKGFSVEGIFNYTKEQTINTEILTHEEFQEYLTHEEYQEYQEIINDLKK